MREEYFSMGGSFERFPETLFQKHDLVALAETEHGIHYREILNFIERFKDEFEDIFIELPLNYQPYINEYAETGRISAELQRLFDGAQAEGKDISGVLVLFKTAYELKKKIICYDPPKIPMGNFQKPQPNGYYLQNQTRDQDMACIIQDHLQTRPGKYLMIGGAGHFETSTSVPDKSQMSLGDSLKGLYGDKFKSFEL